MRDHGDDGDEAERGWISLEDSLFELHPGAVHSSSDVSGVSEEVPLGGGEAVEDGAVVVLRGRRGQGGEGEERSQARRLEGRVGKKRARRRS